MAAVFSVSQSVWLKKAGSTPYVTGDASDAGKAVGTISSVGTGAAMLGGRGKSAITFTPSTFGLGTVQGVPQIAAADFPTPLDSKVVVSGTYNADGKNVRGVLSQITNNNPFTPGVNTTDGQFNEPTPVSPVNPGTNDGFTIDEGLTYELTMSVLWVVVHWWLKVLPRFSQTVRNLLTIL